MSHRKREPLTLRVLRVLYNATVRGKALTRAELFARARVHPATEITRPVRDLRKDSKRRPALQVPCARALGERVPRYWLSRADVPIAAQILGVSR
jgi:hypothetical protein